MIVLHRSRVLVAAAPQADGSVLVIGQDGAEVTLSAEAFATQYAPATVDEVRRLAPTSNGNGTATLAAPARKALPAASGPTRKPQSVKAGRKVVTTGKAVPPEILDYAEQLWREGKSAAEVAAAVTKRGRPASVATVYNWSSKNNWKRAKGSVANPEPAAPPAPVASAVAVKEPVKPRPIAVPRPAAAPKEEKKDPVPRRCETCGLVTEKDPCSKCGAKMVNWKGVWS